MEKESIQAHNDKPLGISEMVAGKRGWPDAQGFKIGNMADYGKNGRYNSGKIIGIEEKKRGKDTVVLVQIEGHQKNTRLKFEVGELKKMKTERELVDYIGQELNSFQEASEAELDILVERITDTLTKMNTGHELSNNKVQTVFVWNIIAQDFKKQVYLKKDENNVYAIHVKDN